MPRRVPANAAASVRAQNEANGIAIDALTSKPGWVGERLDVGYAIDVLHPRAANRPEDSGAADM